MNALTNLPIVNGPAPMIMAILGALAMLWLGWGTTRQIARGTVTALSLSALLTLAFWYYAEKVCDLWGDSLPIQLYIFAGLALFTLIMAAPKVLRLRKLWARVLVAPVVVVAVTCAAGLINQDFEYYPTIGSLVGDNSSPVLTLAEFHATLTQTINRRQDHSQVLTVNIPGTTSHMASTPGYVYLPPAYFDSAHTQLPVLVLIHGLPGSSIDWLRGGQVTQFMDRYAAGHKGLAPVVVMPDVSNKQSNEPPACLDSDAAQASTYLAHDLPSWVKSTFNVGTQSPQQWAIGGFSYGGTCAMTMAVNHPEVYPTFIDSSGEGSPSNGKKHDIMLAKYFKGNAAAFDRQDALHILTKHRFFGSAGLVTVGATDRTYRPQGIEVYNAMKRAGMDVRLQVAPGGHAWPAWRSGVYDNMDWLMARMTATPAQWVSLRPQWAI